MCDYWQCLLTPRVTIERWVRKAGGAWDCGKGEGRTNVSIALILDQLFLCYQESPDMGGKCTFHALWLVPMRWWVPPDPSYRLIFGLRARFACRALSQSHRHTKTYNTTQAPPWTIQISWLQHTLQYCLGWQIIQKDVGGIGEHKSKSDFSVVSHPQHVTASVDRFELWVKWTSENMSRMKIKITFWQHSVAW